MTTHLYPLRFNLFSVFLGSLLALSVVGCQKPATEPAGTPEQSTPVESPSEQPQPSTSAGVIPAPEQPLEYINQLSEAEIADGWLLLFDNETLFGWRKQNDVNWSVQEQAIVADAGPIGLLMTQVRFADFELALEYKGSPGANGGVFLRCTDDPQDPVTDCYEVNIADGHPQGFQTGSIVGLKPADSGQPTTDNTWRTMHIKAVGPAITVTIDGLTLEYTDEREQGRRNGYVGLQKNAGTVGYRNIRIKPLQLESLFNGNDLTGWHEVPGGKSVIDVVKEQIHVVNGPGFLETEQTFKDFVLQFQALTMAPELNSGLFFRAERGTAEAPSNGYEVQIHNGFENDDRNQPNNAGTGAIFRRVDARRVVSSDQAWCTITLVADGPQIATWVEGYPVVNWRDEREPDPNPRRGLRTEAGHLSLQGHDPTTDLYFRNIFAAEFPE